MKCTICQHVSSMKLLNHITYKTSCPKCKMSQGEYKCMQYLNSINIEYIRGAPLGTLIMNPFDFYFQNNNRNFLLEYDGKQHFEFNNFFHRTHDCFIERQDLDIKKTRIALPI